MSPTTPLLRDSDHDPHTRNDEFAADESVASRNRDVLRRSRLRLFALTIVTIALVLGLFVGSSHLKGSHDELFRKSHDRLATSRSDVSREIIDVVRPSSAAYFEKELVIESSVIPSSSSCGSSPSLWRMSYDRYRVGCTKSINLIGSFITSVLFGDGSVFDEPDQDIETENVLDGTWSSWSESSILVEATQAMYASRPSSFGPHILLEPIQSHLYPITTFANSDMHGCNESLTSSSESDLPSPPRQGWIALVERGHCPFSTKVRFAQERNAVAVVFGDQSIREGGVSGIGGLLTPWSPDDTKDVRIPSTFVSRASYLSLLRTWQDVQGKNEKEPKGLLVTLSKDELFAWPLLDLLVLILFLPSLLTLLTVFSQRIRMIRQRRADRAPRDAVAKLPVFLWGDTEKAPTNGDSSKGAKSTQDEEHAIGGSTSESTIAAVSSPDETTPLLSRPPPIHATEPAYLKYLPEFITRRRRPGSQELSASMTSQRRANRKFVASNECSICLSDFEKGEWVMELPCGHLFHKDEIEPWLLESKRVCPVCRASITSDGTLEEDEESSLRSPVPAAVPALTVIPSSPQSNPNEPAASVPTDIPNQALPIVAASPVASSSSVTLEDSRPNFAP